MNHATHLESSCDHTLWRWPLDPARYDRLYGCRLQQTMFWQWDEATWVEILGADQRSLHQRKFPRKLDAGVRPCMVAIAYLLDCFSAFQLLGAFKRLALAMKVFGPALVEEATNQIMTILQGWGYHGATSRDKYPGLICTLLLLNRSPYLADLTTASLEQFRTHSAIHPLMRATSRLFVPSSMIVKNGSGSHVASIPRAPLQLLEVFVP